MHNLKNLFTPNSSNNFKSKSIQTSFLSSYLVITLIAALAFTKINHAFPNVLGFATDITTQKLFELTNNERQKDGLAPFTYNEKLAQAADAKAHDMFARNYWAHYGPDGTTPWNFILNAKYQYEYAGENLARNFLFSNGVVHAWMNSKTHRENILRKEYSEVGLAVVNGTLNGEPTTLVVQMFGTPLPGQVASVTTPPPIIKPTSIPNQLVSNPAVVAHEVQPSINIFPAAFKLNILLMGALIFILLIDFYIAARMNIIRVGGKHLAHVLFLGFILIAVMLFTKGAIL